MPIEDNILLVQPQKQKLMSATGSKVTRVFFGSKFWINFPFGARKSVESKIGPKKTDRQLGSRTQENTKLSR